MTNILKNKTIIILSSVFLLLTLALPISVSAQTPPAPKPPVTQETQNAVRCGSDINLGSSTCAKSSTASTNLNNLIKAVINIFSAVVGAVSVIMIIVGGFRYIISGGDSNNVGAAKNTILYAVVGLVLVAVAQIIVQFVLERTT